MQQQTNPFQEIIDRLERIEFQLIQHYAKENSQKEDLTDKFLTVPEAAKFLGLAVQTIYGLISRKEIPSMKRQKRVYFSKAQLTKWIEDGRRLTRYDIASNPRPTLVKRGGAR